MMRTIGVLVSLSVASCEPETEDEAYTDDSEVPPEAEPATYEYQSFCWTGVEEGCRFDGGDRASDVRVECFSEDVYSCVVDKLNEEGQDGWQLVISGEAFPNDNVVYLMVRTVR